MFRKMIISDVGEVTQDRRTVGDRIRYRIYYGGLPELPASEVTIVDVADENLSKIEVFHDGVYDRATRTITWTVPAIRFKRNAYVEFEAMVGHDGVITNRATATAGPSRPVRSNAVTTTATRPPRLGWIPLREDAERGTPPRSYLKDETTTGITMRFDLAGLFVHGETVGGVAYQHVTIPGRASTTDIGRPGLPVIGEIIEVPFGVDFSPVVVNAESIQLTGYNVYPAQEPRVERRPAGGAALAPAGVPAAPAAAGRQPPFAIDAATYLADADYPGTPVSISTEDIGVIRGHRVLLLKVEPVQYNPVTRTLTVHKMIEVRVRFSHPAQVKGADARLHSRDFDELLSATVLNYKPPERLMPEGGGGEHELGCDYLIITHDAFYTESDPANPVLRLADWKRRKGYRTKVVRVSTIPGGGNTPNAIQAYLQNAYDNWNSPPTYVLLIGEADLVRAVPGVHHDDENDPFAPQPQVETDLRYVTLDGNDYFPDIFIGRISADTLQQVTDTIDKIIKYEQDPPANTGFYTNVSLVGLFTETDDPTINGQEDRPWIANMETIRGLLQGHGYTVERIYATDSGFPANPTAQDPRRFNDGISLPNDLLSPQYGWNGNAAQISNAINAGRFLVTYRAHGGWDGWTFPAFRNGNVQALTQNDLTPLVISITCQTGWFDNETDDPMHGGRPVGDDCFAEAMLRRPRAGAVGLLGMTRNSYTGMNDFLVFGAYKAIWPDFDPDPPWAGHPQAPPGQQVSLRKFGQIANFSKMYMARAYPGAGKRQLEFEMHHLFGDPETTLWTSAPHGLSVDHPAAIGALGLQEFAVKVRDQVTGQPVAGAAVVLTRDHNIVRMQQTRTDGLAVFSILNAGASDLDLTVTALDHRPYLGTLPVTHGGAELNRIDPGDGPEGQIIHVGGRGFAAGETVEIYFGQLGPTVTTAGANGDFGQAVPAVDLTVPASHPHGLVNVYARGVTSQRSAVRLFQVRDKNPVDLWTYDQWAPSTWVLHPGDNPTWNSPDIQLYDSSNNPADSANLVFGEQYTVKATVHNKAAFPAPGANVVFKWADFGAGGPWEDLAVAGADIQAGPSATTEAQTGFQPPGVGHICLQVTIEHVEDNDATNNAGQENLHIGFSGSAAEACITVWNPADHPAPVYFEVRQLLDPAEQNRRLWETSVRHPDPQMLNPGDRARAYVVVDPGRADVPGGTKAEFAVTCFIDGTMIGGVNLMIIKR